MQKQLHISDTGGNSGHSDKPLRPFCGWGQLHFPPCARKRFELNLDSHVIFRVLVGSIEFELGDGVDTPQLAKVSFGDTFVVRPFNFYGLRNASNNAWTVLFYIHSLHSFDAGGGAAPLGGNTNQVTLAEDESEQHC